MVAGLELVVDFAEFRKNFRHDRFKRRLVVARFQPRRLGEALRRADARHHVLALRVQQKLTVEFLRARGGIAGEGDAGGAGIAHIAEHHGLDTDRRAPVIGDIVEAAVGFGPCRFPGAEHRRDRAPELGMNILREGLAKLLLHAGLVFLDDRRPILRREVGIQRMPIEVAVIFQNVFKQMVPDTEHHV